MWNNFRSLEQVHGAELVLITSDSGVFLQLNGATYISTQAWGSAWHIMYCSINVQLAKLMKRQDYLSRNCWQNWLFLKGWGSLILIHNGAFLEAFWSQTFFDLSQKLLCVEAAKVLIKQIFSLFWGWFCFSCSKAASRIPATSRKVDPSCSPYQALLQWTLCS